MKHHTVKINEENYEKLKQIKDIGEFKSINHVLEAILPQGTMNSWDFEQEQPAFTLLNKKDEATNITWNMLKDSEVGSTFKSTDSVEVATVIYKDSDGCLIKFNYDGEVFLNYFYFL